MAISPSIRTYVLAGPESYDNVWQKTRANFKYIGAHYADQYDYFMYGTDDSFVIPGKSNVSPMYVRCKSDVSPM